MNDRGARETLDAIYRAESRRVLATLIRILGGFDAAEEALHEAFAAAAAQWPRQGVPQNPYSWLVSTGRNRTVDRRRRQARLEGAFAELATQSAVGDEIEEPHIRDDELRLLLTCCHPLLPPDARIALTLREVFGLTTEEIARAFLVSTPTIAQRIVRAKAKIKDEAIPYEVPDRLELPARIESALRVVYLIFNEGYAASFGPSFTRDDLSAEAIRLGRLVASLSDDAEGLGLLALMLLHESRRATRVDANGDLVLLENQDRAQWDRAKIAEAQTLIDRALTQKRVGPFLLQAAIAAVHAEGASSQATDWPQIVGLYDVLRRVDPSPVVALNRAAAIGMRDGAEAGLAAIESVISTGALDDYYLAHAARADMQRRLGLIDLALRSYRRAKELTRQPAERRFLESRIAELTSLGKV